jgi:membrane-anchored protein YejM (alkaline phosphatase superfamily)
MNPFPSPRDEFRYSLNDFSVNPSESLDITVRKGALLSRNGGRILAVKDSAAVDIHNPEGLDACRLEAQGNINLFPAELKQGYVREVEYMDQKIGELMSRLRTLDLWDRTLLIAAGDHGEGLGDYLEHRQELYFGHIHYLKSVYTHIPLIIKTPDQRLSGKEVKDPVSLLDIAPALLYRMGWASNKFYQGRNLFKLDKNQDTFMFQ